MSRSGYTDEEPDDLWRHIMWRGAVASAMRGKRSQALLIELRDALDAMPVKELIANDFKADGAYCTLGVLGAKRGIDMSNLGDAEDCDVVFVGDTFGVNAKVVQEIMWENDEGICEDCYVDVEICGPMRPHYPDYGRHRRTVRVPDPNAGHRRWSYMREWVERHIRKDLS